MGGVQPSQGQPGAIRSWERRGGTCPAPEEGCSTSNALTSGPALQNGEDELDCVKSPSVGSFCAAVLGT